MLLKICEVVGQKIIQIIMIMVCVGHREKVKYSNNCGRHREAYNIEKEGSYESSLEFSFFDLGGGGKE